MSLSPSSRESQVKGRSACRSQSATRVVLPKPAGAETSVNRPCKPRFKRWMSSDRAAELWVEAGTVPIKAIDPSKISTSPLFADLMKAWGYMNTNDAVGHYLDWASPTFFDTVTASIEELQSFQITPEEFLQQLEADYAAYLEEKASQ